MSVYVEAMLLLLPADAGGRTAPVAPRDGSYRPFTRIGDHASRLRVLEGPPRVAPGEQARVVVEVEDDAQAVIPGAELQLFEHDERMVGLVTVMRVCRMTLV